MASSSRIGNKDASDLNLRIIWFHIHYNPTSINKMDKQYLNYLKQFSQQTFSQLQDHFKSQTPKFIPTLLPYTHQISSPSKSSSSSPMKQSPFLNHNQKQYQNIDNLYLRIIEMFKNYLLAKQRSVAVFIAENYELSLVSKMLSQLEHFRNQIEEFNVVFGLFKMSKRQIRCFVKMRADILQKYTFDKTKFDNIAFHNKRKYWKDSLFIEKIKVSDEDWGYYLNMNKYNYDKEIFENISYGKRQIGALTLVKFSMYSGRAMGESFVKSK